MKALFTLTAICCAALLPTAHSEENILKNLEFSGNRKPWKIFSIKEHSKPDVTIQDGIVDIKIDKAGNTHSARQITQALPTIQEGKRYLLSFDAKSPETDTDLKVILSRSKDFKKGSYGLDRTVKLSEEWQTYMFRIDVTPMDEDNPAQLKVLFGLFSKGVSFRNFSLKPIKAKKKTDNASDPKTKDE